MGYPIQASHPGDVAPLRKAPGGKFGAFLPANRVFVLTRVQREFRSAKQFGSTDGFRADAPMVNAHPRLAETSETPFFWFCSTPSSFAGKIAPRRHFQNPESGVLSLCSSRDQHQHLQRLGKGFLLHVPSRRSPSEIVCSVGRPGRSPCGAFQISCSVRHGA
jgi:hypothetical protein